MPALRQALAALDELRRPTQAACDLACLAVALGLCVRQEGGAYCHYYFSQPPTTLMEELWWELCRAVGVPHTWALHFKLFEAHFTGALSHAEVQSQFALTDAEVEASEPAALRCAGCPWALIG